MTTNALSFFIHWKRINVITNLAEIYCLYYIFFFLHAWSTWLYLILYLGPWLICLFEWYPLRAMVWDKNTNHHYFYLTPFPVSLLKCHSFLKVTCEPVTHVSLTVQYVFERCVDMSDMASDAICLTRWHLQYINLSLDGTVCCSKSLKSL